ncbi:MAG TPA: phosphotransferase [Kofleriaceae bacterium]
MIPAEVAAAWGWRDEQIAPLAGGLINATFAVREDGAPIAVLQRLHPVFGPRVNLDLEAVTAFLAARGMTTPRLLRTREGAPWVEHDGRTWRALTWIDGETVHAVPDAAWAEAGGELVGRFHRTIADLEYDYQFTRSGVHDTAAHVQRLRECQFEGEARELAAEILEAARTLPLLGELPRRHCHGDLKISNLLFARDPLRGVCLLDLDTFQRGTLAFELGDAMRSWCNPRGEDVTAVGFDLEIFAAAMRGVFSAYGAAAPPIAPDERASIVTGLETVCIELAARFCADVYFDSYFGWDAARFPSRRAHNLVRARGQLVLGLSVRAARADALAIVLR